MASRKTAATDKPATRTTAKKAAGSATTKKAPARKSTAAGGASRSSTAKKAPAKKAPARGAKPAAKKPAVRKSAATTEAKAMAVAAITGKPSARASKKVLSTPARAPKKEVALEHGASFETAKIAANAALDKKAENVVILDVRGLTSYADYFVVASGSSDRQVTAIADSVEEKMKKSGHRTIGVEGYTRGHWVLLDFGDVVAHVFYEEARAFYDIEGLWADARRIPME